MNPKSPADGRVIKQPMPARRESPGTAVSRRSNGQTHKADEVLDAELEAAAEAAGEGAGQPDWQTIALWAFVVVCFTVFILAGYLILAKSRGTLSL